MVMYSITCIPFSLVDVIWLKLSSCLRNLKILCKALHNIFKTWKSIFGIDSISPMKYERLMCLLNVRLLLILINWELFMHKRCQVFESTQKLLSIMKCFKTMHEHNHELRHILTDNCKKLSSWSQRISKLLESKHWLEKKKNKIGFMEIIMLNVF
jgi:hypothetical protein